MFRHPHDVPETFATINQDSFLTENNCTSTKKNLAGTTAVHRGNSQSCGQLSNKYTDLFSPATEKQKSLHASQSEQ